VVIIIILILAGLILSISSYVQNKGARARAETEIAAMSAALESYKADNGIYPQTSATEFDT
jgi:type II secretory pathway pseudopilin PulG